MKLGKRTRWFIIYPLLLACALHTFLTGFPIPTWDLEHLTSPVPVQAIKPDGLVLSDGRKQKLPLVKRLPADDPLMLGAVKNGVEITKDGDVFGLLWVNRTCGLEPYWIRRRVNLALLAAILLPDNFDEAETPADVLAQVREEDQLFTDEGRPRRYDEGRINIYDLARMHRMEHVLEHPWKPVEKQERWQWTFPAGFLDE